jgi:hypothetical protein
MFFIYKINLHLKLVIDEDHILSWKHVSCYTMETERVTYRQMPREVRDCRYYFASCSKLFSNPRKCTSDFAREFFCDDFTTHVTQVINQVHSFNVAGRSRLVLCRPAPTDGRMLEEAKDETILKCFLVISIDYLILSC